MEPIWKDYTVQIAATAVANGVQYRVIKSDGSAVYFQGRAYPRPSANKITAKINDIIAPQLVRGITALSETDVYSLEVKVQYYGNDSAWHDIVTKEFVPDWSYDLQYNPTTDGMNFLAGMTIMPGQLVPITTMATGTSAVLEIYDGVADFNPDFNADFLILGGDSSQTIAVAGGGATTWIDLRQYPGAVSLTYGGRRFPIGGGCHQYSLIYTNAYGGWDFLVVTGRVKESDDLTHHTTERVYDNGTTSARGRVNYANELAHRYTFNTGWMNDAAAQIVQKHLVSSPCVYLQDVVSGIVRPIVLTDSNTNYDRNGGLYRLSLDAELAQDRIRR